MPRTIEKAVAEMMPQSEDVDLDGVVSEPMPVYDVEDVFAEIETLEVQMKAAASVLEFEKAAAIRDKIVGLRAQITAVAA